MHAATKVAAHLNANPLRFAIPTCPPEELYYCWLWEAAREMDDVVDAVISRRKMKEATFDQHFDQFYANRVFSRPLPYPTRLLVLSPEFPKAAYLAIPKRERDRRIGILFPNVTHYWNLGFPTVMNAAAVRELLEGKDGKNYSLDGTLMTTVLQMDLSRSAAKLTREFGIWLQQNRPIQGAVAQGTSRQKKCRELLKALIAWRLLRVYDIEYPIAAEAYRRANKGQELYSDLPGWDRACRMVEKAMQSDDFRVGG